jgi:hypothetical protein
LIENPSHHGPVHEQGEEAVGGGNRENDD